ncbi:stage III sporulation protein AB [Thermincola ferriacetica]|uniref:Stage III sporulation protein AB n=1 Tax=Thermincola ferriacetica TaxID=281456 RepID=A0A0L6W6H1_9FIRM|nr:stage III sporulation protein AB [Thermincola ferriacetica]KNZ70709.1 stage III sporulation protein AB [Thermincola ferriacetica]
MLKLIGAFLAVAACGGIGLTVAQHYIQRPKQLRAMLSALQMLETEIVYGATPLPDAMENVGRNCDEKIGRIFLAARDFLCSAEGLTAGEAWHLAVEKYGYDLAFIREDLSVLKRISGFLGCSDRDDQSKHLQLTREQLRYEIAKAEAVAQSNGKVWKSLGFLFGLVLVLMVY